MKWLKYGAIGFVGIIATAVIVLYLMSFRAGAGKISASAEINRPPAEVWTWIEENDKFKQWVSWTVDVREEGPNGVGRKRRITMRDPNMNNELVYLDAVTTDFVPPKHLRVTISSPLGYSGTIIYDLEDLGGRTRLSKRGEFKYDHWYFTLLEPIVMPQAKAKEHADLATLKRLVEQ